MSSLEQADLKKLPVRLVIAANSNSYTVFPALVYMVGLITGLNKDEAIWLLIWALPVAGTLFAAVGPYVFIKKLVENAFATNPGERASARLERILKIPRQMEVGLAIGSVLSILTVTAAPVVRFGKNLWLIPWTLVVVSLLVFLLMIQLRPGWERILRPYALAEFHKNPEAIPQGSGIFWVRQRWYLPYAFGVFVACTIATVTSVLLREGYNNFLHLREQMLGPVTPDQFLSLLDGAVAKMVSDALLPLGLLGSYLLVSAAFSAWQLSRYQTEAAQSVQTTVEALASGEPKLPEWVSTDEIGDLAAATAKAFGRLKAFSASLGESAHALRRSAEQLGLSTSKQTEALTHQATALQETQVTAQEIKQTSALTAQKAEGILQQTEKADQISRAGEAAIQQSLNGLQEIGEQVKEMARQIRNLDQRTRQIASITTTVKDLADQSNMLALNAAIEAVRSGEHGKGFGVVAREIRTLADQSIRATNNVRSILQDISTAIRTTVSMTEKGSEKVESSLIQVREFGNNITELSGIVRDNAASVRQITAAVTQQNTGITQIFQAVNDLSRLMDQTMVQLRTSDEALDLVRNVTDKVAAMSGESRSSTAPRPVARGTSVESN
ncbi:methyl-accepting chemotaxis protein [Archangium gephyra]|uniref:methyl-accepting chemotaxis protein n=1 Tax=Archangium gephyra TaxID=48 RepID=UPI003B820BDF